MWLFVCSANDFSIRGSTTNFLWTSKKDREQRSREKSQSAKCAKSSLFVSVLADEFVIGDQRKVDLYLEFTLVLV